jgi:hypothetical protein
MQNKLSLQVFIEPGQAGSYFTLPFSMPADTERLHITYRYERHQETASRVDSGAFISHREVNIIDLGLVAPDGTQVGASGSDKTEIWISETQATPGYHATRLAAGEWRILVGAYKISPQGVNVTYELEFVAKQVRLLKGDLHAHTLASDGVLTAEELGWRALRHGLDFLAITDHNQMVSRDGLPQVPGLTFIPGVEWTHFQGHANFLGADRPYDMPFFTSTLEEARVRFDSARERGALITINHPLETPYAFQFDLDSLPFDCLEVWNGPMREPNLRAVGLWQSLLASGKKIPICGGSDFHRDSPFLFLGGPTTCVYAMSPGVSDILEALRLGHAFITFAPDGPTLEFTAGDAMMGDTVSWARTQAVEIDARGLRTGDAIRIVTAGGSTDVFETPSTGRFQTSFPVSGPGFARIEIWRTFLPGLPMLPALLSNPIYFDFS